MLIDSGNELLGLDRYEEAITRYDSALAIQQDCYELWNNRGVALAMLNRIGEARNSYDRALRLSSNSPEAWNNRGYCLVELRCYTQAKETPSIGKQSQLRLEFLDFDRLRVDQLAQSSKAEDRKAALELAEKHKNLCLRYCLYGWSGTDMDSLRYSDMQRLLNPDTALIYWHISPAAVTTFILRFQKPLLIWKYSRVQNFGRYFLVLLSTFLSFFIKKAKLQGFDYPPATRQLQDFEAWVKEWKKQYQEYRIIEDAGHPWRQHMQKRLNKLGRILNITAISWELKNISQVILIPHRDLHLLPVDITFPERFTISYLPSAQVGIDLQKRRNNSGRRFLSVENPRNDLSSANVESAGIRRLLHPDIPCSLRGKQATLANVIEALQSCEGVFHFAGHAQHDINQPLESALLLAGGQELLLHKILQLDLSRFRLVCLSACETGITGQEDLINEFVGLVSGFLAAGATSAISSLWLAGDLSTAFLMIKFHENLNISGSVAVALNQAQKWLRNLTVEELDIALDKLNPQIDQVFAQLPKSKYKIFEASLEQARKRKPYPFANPYYWAAFITTGF